LRTERDDLTLAIETLKQTWSWWRTGERERSDYEEATEEMEKAINALTASMEVLKEATEDHKTGVCAK